jgi:hypothetical protein
MIRTRIIGHPAIQNLAKLYNGKIRELQKWIIRFMPVEILRLLSRTLVASELCATIEDHLEAMPNTPNQSRYQTTLAYSLPVTQLVPQYLFQLSIIHHMDAITNTSEAIGERSTYLFGLYPLTGLLLISSSLGPIVSEIQKNLAHLFRDWGLHRKNSGTLRREIYRFYPFLNARSHHSFQIGLVRSVGWRFALT